LEQGVNPPGERSPSNKRKAPLRTPPPTQTTPKRGRRIASTAAPGGLQSPPPTVQPRQSPLFEPELFTQSAVIVQGLEEVEDNDSDRGGEDLGNDEVEDQELAYRRQIGTPLFPDGAEDGEEEEEPAPNIDVRWRACIRDIKKPSNGCL
jgi:hypothetical protein